MTAIRRDDGQRSCDGGEEERCGQPAVWRVDDRPLCEEHAAAGIVLAIRASLRVGMRKLGHGV